MMLQNGGMRTSEQLTEYGYFNWRNIEDSVLDYCEELKLIQPGYNPDDEEDEYADMTAIELVDLTMTTTTRID